MPSNSNTSESKQKHTPFAVVESYKTIRTNLLFLLSQHHGKSITISSANESEGKSTTAVNTAIAFSQLGSKVILIDSDMRKPSVHKKVHIANAKGLSSVLVGFCKFEEAVNSINPNLDVLTSGPTPPNPSEILGSEAFAELIKSLNEKYDYIIIDTPPINIVSDAIVIAPNTDGIVMVIKDFSTQHDDFKRAISSIEFANLKLFGVVLNAANPKTNNKYRYHKYNYYTYANSSNAKSKK